MMITMSVHDTKNIIKLPSKILVVQLLIQWCIDVKV